MSLCNRKEIVKSAERIFLMTFNPNLTINSASRKKNIFETVTLLMLFFSAVNFASRFEYFLFLAFVVFVVTPNRSFRLNLSFLILCFFSLFQLFFNVTVQSSLHNAITAFVFPISYIMGCSFVSAKDSFDDHNGWVNRVILITSSGTLVHFLLNWYENRDSGHSGMAQIERNTHDFWTKDVLSATGQATLACLALCVIAAFLFSNVDRRKKLIASMCLLAIIMYNLVLAGRTILALLLVLVAFSFLFRMFAYKKGNLKTIVVVLVILVAIFLIYQNDVFGVKSSLEDSNLYDRFNGKNSQDIDDDTRLEHKLAYLNYLDRYPFGGNNIRTLLGFSAHDLYLDTYDESGVFATLMVIAYIIASITRVVKCVKNRLIPIETRHLVACVYLGVNIQFWIEPIMRGTPWLLAFYCLIDGTVTAMLDRVSRK